MAADCERAPDLPFLRVALDGEGYHVEHCISGEAFLVCDCAGPKPELRADAAGFALCCAAGGEVLCHTRLTQFVATYQGELVLVDPASSARDLPTLCSLRREHEVQYEVFMVGERLSVKTYLFNIERGGAALFWDIRDWWQSLKLDLSYKRGGEDSCRHILDRWSSWQDAAKKLGIDGQHFLKPRTSTRGVASHIPGDRFLPTAAVSTFAFLSIMVQTAGTCRAGKHKARAQFIFRQWLDRFVPGSYLLRVHIDPQASVHWDKHHVESAAGPCVELPMENQRVQLDKLLEHDAARPLRRKLTGQCSEVELVTLLCDTMRHDGALGWLWAQLVFWIGLAWENEYEEYSQATTSPAAGASRRVPGQKADPHLLSSLVQENTTVRIKRKSSTADLECRAEMAKQRALLCEGEETHFWRKDAYRYRQASRDEFKHASNISLSFDGVRSCKKEWVLVAAMNPASNRSCWLPPQDPHFINLLNSVSLVFPDSQGSAREYLLCKNWEYLSAFRIHKVFSRDSVSPFLCSLGSFFYFFLDLESSWFPGVQRSSPSA